MTLSGLMVLSRLGSDVSGRLQLCSIFFFFVLGAAFPNVVVRRPMSGTNPLLRSWMTNGDGRLAITLSSGGGNDRVIMTTVDAAAATVPSSVLLTEALCIISDT